MPSKVYAIKVAPGESTLLLVHILFMAIVICRAVAKVRDSGSVGISNVGLVWIHLVRSDLDSLHALELDRI